VVMMVKIKEKDFVEIDYTGRIKEDNVVFDTTLKSVAEKEGIEEEGQKYKPAVICVGENQVIVGIDEALVDKEMGADFKIDVEPEKAFGKKNAKLLRMIPQRTFRKQDIDPQVGLQVQIDGHTGIIRSANSGRIIVDFNHPLSGKALTYEIKVNKNVTDPKIKVQAIISPIFPEAKVEVHEKKVVISLDFDIPEEVTKQMVDKIVELVPEIEEAKFEKSEATPQK